MLDPLNQQLSTSRQCEIVGISRSSYYYQPTPISLEELELMRKIYELYLENPSSGSRTISRQIGRQGITANRKRVQRLMQLMGIEAVYSKPRTSRRYPQNTVYPYLLRELTINHPNQVWATDITYIPMARGSMYLVPAMDWYSRKILSWRISNTLETAFCVEALEEALSRYATPEIFNTDQGAQFTSDAFTKMLEDNHVAISMDGRGRCQDNIFVERLWWTLKHQHIYLHSFDTSKSLRRGLGGWIRYYNYERGLSSLDNRTPDEVYDSLPHPFAEAA